MGSVIVGLIFLVGLVVIIGIILRVLFGIAGAGKRALGGPSGNSRLARGEWRGIPIPVKVAELRGITDIPIDPPPPPGHHVVFFMPGSHLSTVARWFRTAWGQVGFIENSAEGSGNEAVITVRDPHSSGTIVAALQLRYSPQYLVAIVLSDLRQPEIGETA